MPPVLPIVLYNGLKPWNAPENVADLIPEIPDFLKQFSPSMKYCLLDENAFEYDDLDKKQNLLAAVFQIERPKIITQIDELLKKLNEWLPKDLLLLRETLAIWTYAIMQTHGDNFKNIPFPQFDHLKELSMTLKQAFDNFYKDSHSKGMQQGILQGIQRGKLEGQIEGEKIILRRLLTKRFGKLPSDISNRIEAADSEQIETWSDAVLDAKSLYEIFENLH